MTPITAATTTEQTTDIIIISFFLLGLGSSKPVKRSWVSPFNIFFNEINLSNLNFN